MEKDNTRSITKQIVKDKNKITTLNPYVNVELLDRKTIMLNNLIGGITWGLGTIIGATLIIGILGILIVNTKKVPLIGNIVEVIQNDIQNGKNSFNMNKS